MVIWWSKSEVTVGHQGGEGIHVDAGASESIFSKGFVPEQVNQESGGISLAGLCWKKWRLHNVGLLILRQIFSSIIFFLSKTGLLVLGVGCSFFVCARGCKFPLTGSVLTWQIDGRNSALVARHSLRSLSTAQCRKALYRALSSSSLILKISLNCSDATNSTNTSALMTSSCTTMFLSLKLVAYCYADTAYLKFTTGMHHVGCSWSSHGSAPMDANMLKLSRDDCSPSIGDVSIKPSPVVRDLGVLLDAELTTKQHVKNVARSCFFQLRRRSRMFVN